MVRLVSQSCSVPAQPLRNLERKDGTRCPELGCFQSMALLFNGRVASMDPLVFDVTNSPRGLRRTVTWCPLAA